MSDVLPLLPLIVPSFCIPVINWVQSLKYPNTELLQSISFIHRTQLNCHCFQWYIIVLHTFYIHTHSNFLVGRRDFSGGLLYTEKYIFLHTVGLPQCFHAWKAPHLYVCDYCNASFYIHNRGYSIDWIGLSVSENYASFIHINKYQKAFLFRLSTSQCNHTWYCYNSLNVKWFT